MVSIPGQNEKKVALTPSAVSQHAFQTSVNHHRTARVFKIRSGLDRYGVHEQEPVGAGKRIEIRVIGLMRSGNHAIIQWLQKLYPAQSVVFLNNVKHGNYDPFLNYSEIEADGERICGETSLIDKSNHDVLIYSYEDRRSLEEGGLGFIESVFDDGFEKNRRTYLGVSDYSFDVFIVRDPFNFFASRLIQLRRDSLGGVENLDVIRSNWKAIAKRVIAVEKHDQSCQVAINYNRWITNSSYQKMVSRRLLGYFSRPSLDDISCYGGGSSFASPLVSCLTLSDLFEKKQKLLDWQRWAQFDRYLTRLLQRPHKRFLTRWRLLVDDPQYCSLFRDPEILALSEQIFGEIPGTRRFVATAASTDGWR